LAATPLVGWLGLWQPVQVIPVPTKVP
jgi:hypothetical protein